MNGLIKVLQVAAFLAIFMGNVYFQWTPNGYLVAIWAFVAAYGIGYFWTIITDKLAKEQDAPAPTPVRLVPLAEREQLHRSLSSEQRKPLAPVRDGPPKRC